MAECTIDRDFCESHDRPSIICELYDLRATLAEQRRENERLHDVLRECQKFVLAMVAAQGLPASQVPEATRALMFRIAHALAEPAAGAPTDDHLESMIGRIPPAEQERYMREMRERSDPYLTSDYEGGGGSDFGPPASTPGGGR
jgi:hypothetical protein